MLTSLTLAAPWAVVGQGREGTARTPDALRSRVAPIRVAPLLRGWRGRQVVGPERRPSP
jgi:hypothetical protein